MVSYSKDDLALISYVFNNVFNNVVIENVKRQNPVSADFNSV